MLASERNEYGPEPLTPGELRELETLIRQGTHWHYDGTGKAVVAHTHVLARGRSEHSHETGGK